MPVHPIQAFAVVLSADDVSRFRRGIGSGLLLASVVWIGLAYAVLLVS